MVCLTSVFEIDRAIMAIDPLEWLGGDQLMQFVDGRSMLARGSRGRYISFLRNQKLSGEHSAVSRVLVPDRRGFYYTFKPEAGRHG